MEPQALPPRSRLRWRSVVQQAGASLVEHPSRTIASLLTVVLGISAAVGMLCVAATARHQVSARFDARRATEVLLRGSSTADAAQGMAAAFPPDINQRLMLLNGVEASGLVLAFEGSASVATNHLIDPLDRNRVDVPVFGVSDGTLDAARGSIDGQWIENWQQATNAPIAVLGRAVADRLNVRSPGRVIYVNGVSHWLVGVLRDGGSAPELTSGLILGDHGALQGIGSPSQDSYVLVRTAPGAAQLIAQQAPLQVRPEAPDRLVATAPADPNEFRQEIEADTENTVIIMAAISVLLGSLNVANSALSSVYQRIPEIGLRRALGATPVHILAQTVAETTSLGLVAGVAGSLIGTAAAFTIALVSGWKPVIDPLVPLFAPVFGVIIGALAGVYPAWRASQIEPSAALRSQ